MAGESPHIPLIRTKLHRLLIARDSLYRQHLLDRLDQRRHRPLTLDSPRRPVTARAPW